MVRVHEIFPFDNTNTSFLYMSRAMAFPGTAGRILSKAASRIPSIQSVCPHGRLSESISRGSDEYFPGRFDQWVKARFFSAVIAGVPHPVRTEERPSVRLWTAPYITRILIDMCNRLQPCLPVKAIPEEKWSVIPGKRPCFAPVEGVFLSTMQVNSLCEVNRQVKYRLH
jgi:hypothetical protein